MGLSSFPGVSEGVLPLLIVNAAVYVAIIRGVVVSVLRKLGLAATRTEPELGDSPWSNGAGDEAMAMAAPLLGSGLAHLAVTADEIRERLAVSKFDMTEVGGCKCIFCLSKVKGGEEIRNLPCGHLFHRKCLDGWLDEHLTCPLCKAHFVPPDEMKRREEHLTKELEMWFSSFLPGRHGF
uniref:RING-type domain-containing protein n=1 Tax=Araucaria cunninghamii TaxID=56994 RepID=A0A0D6R5N4_ARACU